MTLAIVIVYLSVCMLFGFYGKARTKTSEDYSLAGRKMPGWMASLSIAATLVGSGVTIGVGELGYSVGISGVLYPTMLGLCLFISMWIAAARFRKSEKYTIPEMLEDYYGPSARLMVAIITMIIFIPPTAAQFLVAGMILSALTGISKGVAITIAAFVIIAYVVIGGMWAIGFTDAFQMVFIYLGLISLAIVSVIKFGGYNTLLAQLPPGHSSWSAIGPIRFTAYLGVLLMFGFISQAWIQKSASVETPEKAKWSGMVAGLLIFPIGFLAVFAGLIARIALPGINPAMAVPKLMLTVFPHVVGGIFLAAVIAACMSSSDSWIHSSATMFVRDIYQRHINPEASDQRVFRYSMVVCLLYGVLAWLIALMAQQEIIMLVLLFIAPGALFIGPLLAAWFSPRKLKKGAGSAIILVVAILGILLSLKRPFLWGVHPALSTTIIAYVLTGLVLLLPWTSYKYQPKRQNKDSASGGLERIG
ncbi:MAG: sodium:solute symporter family protein [Planctomycetota bacterium]|jgi:SSS family solute:Na+ symporter